MHKLIKPIFWTSLFLLALLALDQFFVQVPPVHPAHEIVSSFYRDFRGRLIDLALGEKKAPKSIEAVIEKQKAGKLPAQSKVKEPIAPKAESSPAADQGTQRYIYSDDKGELHFVDSLDDVPDQFRKQAQPMSR